MLFYKIHKLIFVIFSPGRPEPPAGRLKIRKVNRESVIIEWNAPGDDGGRRITDYIVEYREVDSLMWHRMAILDGYTRSCTVAGLEDDTDYMFRVIAVNEIGDSDPLEVDLAVRPLRTAGKLNQQIRYYRDAYTVLSQKVVFAYCLLDLHGSIVLDISLTVTQN